MLARLASGKLLVQKVGVTVTSSLNLFGSLGLQPAFH
jgi:hypothetical protein